MQEPRAFPALPAHSAEHWSPAGRPDPSRLWHTGSVTGELSWVESTARAQEPASLRLPPRSHPATAEQRVLRGRPDCRMMPPRRGSLAPGSHLLQVAMEQQPGRHPGIIYTACAYRSERSRPLAKPQKAAPGNEPGADDSQIFSFPTDNIRREKRRCAGDRHSAHASAGFPMYPFATVTAGSQGQARFLYSP